MVTPSIRQIMICTAVVLIVDHLSTVYRIQDSRAVYNVVVMLEICDGTGAGMIVAGLQYEESQLSLQFR